MKSMIRHFIAVTFGLCLFMLFSISSFASTGYPWFQVPGNTSLTSVRLYYYDSSNTQKYVTGSVSTGGVVYITKPSDFVTQSSPYGPRIMVYIRNSGQAYYGATFESSNVTFIDNEPGTNISGASVCWASKGYSSSGKIYSVASNFVNPSSSVRFGSITIYHPSGVDGGTAITASDFPITFKVNSYAGQFNYSGIPDNGVYNIDTINSNKANTSIELTGELSEDVQILSTEVSTLESDISSSFEGFQSTLEWLTYNLTVNRYNSATGSTWTDSNGRSHNLATYYHNTFSIQNEHVVRSSTQKCGTALGILYISLTDIWRYFLELQEIYFQWFYPLKSSTPQYWNVYNTDTDDTELVNPSTVTYYITWYLGQLFLMGNENTPLGDLQDHVDDIKDQFQSVESQEQSIIDSIDDSFSTFLPDLSQIGSFRALSWCSNYLQQIYVSLGAYGTVILIGLLLGVCMQFIGYFRYK